MSYNEDLLSLRDRHHKSSGPPALSVVLTLLVLAGCSSPLIREFGDYVSPDGTKHVLVTRREISLVDFEVIDVATGKQIAKDYVGSDAMRWFLYWEDSSRLWGYGSDIGYFKVFEFASDNSVVITEVTPLMRIPLMVWKNLPSSMQRVYRPIE